MTGPTRCPWVPADPLYTEYHDVEWGRPVHGDTALFERMALEGFQSGLAWITILRKREAFRRAFAGFDPHLIADFGQADRERLMADAGIVRNGRKIDAVIANAAVLRDWQEVDGPTALDELIWDHRPDQQRRPRQMADLPAQTPESVALAKALKRRGFVFVGPTTMYALMQACGLVNDHVEDCEFAQG